MKVIILIEASQNALDPKVLAFLYSDIHQVHMAGQNISCISQFMKVYTTYIIAFKVHILVTEFNQWLK